MNTIKKLLLIALIFAPLALHASIAKFSALSGDVSIIESGKKSQATIDSKIDKSDKIVTGENGKAQIVFKDNTVITLGINSDFAIEEYFSDAKKPKASFSIGKGTFKALTGAMGKINPEGFKLKTKTATIGIRGTGILGQVTPTENKIACTQGTITVSPASDPGVVVTVPAGQITSLTPGTPPTPPRAYSPQEVGDIESSSGVGEMPSDTQTQEASGGVEGGTEGATAPAEEANADDEGAANEGDTAEEGTTEETATNEEGETTTAEADTEADTTEDTITATEDDVALPTTTEALPEATDIDVADNIAVGGITSDDQTENFLQETAEALGVDVDRLTGELDGLTLEELEELEDIIPEGTEGAGGETYTYADDRDVELYGIFGGGSHDELNPDAGLGAYLTNTADALNSVWLQGYEFDIDIGVADPPMDEHFSFPRTPVSDSYAWYNSASIATYLSSDASELNALFGSEINNGTVSTWLGGSEIIFFDSKQEFFVYHAVGNFEGTDSYHYKVEKVAVMGERASWANKPTAMYTYGDVFDGSLLKINYSNNRMLSITHDNGDVVVGSVTDSSGYVGLNGEGYDGSTGTGYIFGSELQGYAVETSDNKISAGYEQLPLRSAPTHIYPSTNPTLNGRAIDPSTDAGVAVSIDRGAGTLGATFGSENFGNSDSGQPSAYLDDGNFAAFNSSNNVFFTTGYDSYTTWGYWGTPSDSFSETRGYWIAGETTDTSYVQDLIDNMGSTESYRYVGWIDGAYYNAGDSSFVNKLGSSSSIDLKIYFSDGQMQANINMLEADNVTTIYSSDGYEDMVNESISTSDFTGNFNGSDFLSGKYYGTNADKVAGSIRHTGGTYKARGIFSAYKQ